MSDWYRDFANSGFGTTLTKQLGLPRPAVLRRYEPGEPLLPGPVVVGSAGTSSFASFQLAHTSLISPAAKLPWSSSWTEVSMLSPKRIR